MFLVRKGNAKDIKDWNDLVKDDVEVITPDPKSSGGACWNFLAALAYARTTYSDEADIWQFMKKLYQNVSVMDSGAEVRRPHLWRMARGDVLIAWENEAIATLREYPEVTR